MSEISGNSLITNLLHDNISFIRQVSNIEPS